MRENYISAHHLDQIELKTFGEHTLSGFAFHYFGDSIQNVYNDDSGIKSLGFIDCGTDLYKELPRLFTTSITNIELTYCFLTSTPDFLEWVSSCPQVEHFNFSFNDLVHVNLPSLSLPNLRVLNLMYNKIFEISETSMCLAPGLEDLDLGYNKLLDEALERLLKDKSPKLKKLNLRGNQLQKSLGLLEGETGILDVDLSFTGISLKQISSVVGKNNTLQRLTLRGTQFKSLGELGHALKQNNTLKVLDLDQGLSMESADLALALVENSSLKCITLPRATQGDCLNAVLSLMKKRLDLNVLSDVQNFYDDNKIRRVKGALLLTARKLPRELVRMLMCFLIWN